MEKQKQAYLCAITAVLFWSTMASAFKVSLRYLDFLHLLFFSSIASVVILFLILLVQNKLSLLREYSGMDYLRSVALGFLNPFLYYVVLFKAYSLLPAQEAQPLNYTWSIVLVLLSIPILRQRIGFKSILAILISYFGVLVISTRGDPFGLTLSNPTGVALALGSSVIWALFWIYNVKDKRDDVAKLFLNSLFGFAFISIALLVFSRMPTSGIRGLAGAAYVGFFEMGITFVLWLKALRLSRTTAQVSNLIYLSPFISLVLIHLIVGETILLSTIIGLVFIVAGIILQQRWGKTTPAIRTS
ncbi:MAG: DMT family transporter [Candidatus Zixiibacteriota bacterium]|nr:MAG: DMT family transporter [candidate division Zixibacteria bacterium]